MKKVRNNFQLGGIQSPAGLLDNPSALLSNNGNTYLIMCKIFDKYFNKKYEKLNNLIFHILPELDIGGMSAFFRAYFLKKVFCLLAPPKHF